MAYYGRDYAEGYDFGYRPGSWQRGRERWSGPGDRERWSGRGYEYRSNTRERPTWANPGSRNEFGETARYGYGHGYGMDYERGYDRGYKSRWQTDYGDPFGDRVRHTPMRVIRGDAREYFGRQRYDRDFSWSPYPISERSFGARSRYDSRYRRPDPGHYDDGIGTWGWAS